MINDQEYITKKLKKILEKMVILSSPRLKNLIAMIIGIINSQSDVLSKISQELKYSYSSGPEESKIKRLQRLILKNYMSFIFINFLKTIKITQIVFI